jgi:hypothetical protein
VGRQTRQIFLIMAGSTELSLLAGKPGCVRIVAKGTVFLGHGRMRKRHLQSLPYVRVAGQAETRLCFVKSFPLLLEMGLMADQAVLILQRRMPPFGQLRSQPIVTPEAKLIYVVPQQVLKLRVVPVMALFTGFQGRGRVHLGRIETHNFGVTLCTDFAGRSSQEGSEGRSVRSVALETGGIGVGFMDDGSLLRRSIMAPET